MMNEAAKKALGNQQAMAGNLLGDPLQRYQSETVSSEERREPIVQLINHLEETSRQMEGTLMSISHLVDRFNGDDSNVEVQNGERVEPVPTPPPYEQMRQLCIYQENLVSRFSRLEARLNKMVYDD